jgi:hypothetical protein
MQSIINVRLAFDAEAAVWFIETSDLHGLRLESATVDELIARLPGAIQDLLEDVDGNKGREVPLEIVAHRSTSVRLEAA